MTIWEKIATSLLALSVFFTGVPIVSAQEGPQGQDTVQEGEYSFPHEVPVGERCVANGETYQCFSLEEFRELLVVDRKLYLRSNLLRNYKEQKYSLEEVNTKLKVNVESLETKVNILEAERERLYQKWEKENKLRHEAENKPMIGSWIAWTLAASEAAVILGLVIGSIL